MNRDDALARAVSSAEAAERLLDVDERLLLTPEAAGAAGVAVDGRSQAARLNLATAHAQVALAWAAVAGHLATPVDERAREALERQRDSSERRSRS